MRTPSCVLTDVAAERVVRVVAGAPKLLQKAAVAQPAASRCWRFPDFCKTIPVGGLHLGRKERGSLGAASQHGHHPRQKRRRTRAVVKDWGGRAGELGRESLGTVQFLLELRTQKSVGPKAAPRRAKFYRDKPSILSGPQVPQGRGVQDVLALRGIQLEASVVQSFFGSL